MEFTSGGRIDIRHVYGRTILKGINEKHILVRLHERRSVLMMTPVSKPRDARLDLPSRHWLTSHTVRGFHQSSWAQFASTESRNWKSITNGTTSTNSFINHLMRAYQPERCSNAFRSNLSTAGFFKQDEKGGNLPKDPEVDNRTAWKWI